MFIVLMNLCGLLTPVLMLLFGLLWLLAAPGRLCWSLGYRSELSMKNRSTWQYAHFWAARLWLGLGALLLIVSLVLVLQNQERLLPAVPLLLAVQMAVISLSLSPVEWLLRRRYTKDGIVRPEQRPWFFFGKSRKGDPAPEVRESPSTTVEDTLRKRMIPLKPEPVAAKPVPELRPAAVPTPKAASLPEVPSTAPMEVPRTPRPKRVEMAEDAPEVRRPRLIVSAAAAMPPEERPPVLQERPNASGAKSPSLGE